MADELAMAFAFVARREGRRSMPASRWAHVLSLDLGWMPPGEAKAAVERATAAAILRTQGDELQFSGDPAAIEVPLGFRPGARAAAVPAPNRREPAPPAPAAIDPFLDWVDRTAAATRRARGDVLRDVAALQDRMGGQLSALAAVLWLAAQAKLDVRAAAAAVSP